MGEFKLLIDTNVFIGLEDTKQINPASAEIVRKCGEHAVGIFVHEAALLDIARDRDATRRGISLSKVRKFQELKSPKLPDNVALETQFGPIRKPNDEVDVALLHALSINAVDLLVTEDQGIHDRVKLTALAGRVLTVADTITWLRRTFDPTPVSFPLIDDKKAYEIDRHDELFASLREDYPDFDEWWNKCIRTHRQCWTVTIDGKFAGLIVRKTETAAEAGTKLSGDKNSQALHIQGPPQIPRGKAGRAVAQAGHLVRATQQLRHGVFNGIPEPGDTDSHT